MHLLICHKNKLLLFQASFTFFYDKYTPNSFKVSLLHKDPSSYERANAQKYVLYA